MWLPGVMTYNSSRRTVYVPPDDNTVHPGLTAAAAMCSNDRMSEYPLRARRNRFRSGTAPTFVITFDNGEGYIIGRVRLSVCLSVSIKMGGFASCFLGRQINRLDFDLSLPAGEGSLSQCTADLWSCPRNKHLDPDRYEQNTVVMRLNVARW